MKVKRLKSISNIPPFPEVEDYEDKIVDYSQVESVVDRKYFIPLSEQSRSRIVNTPIDKSHFTFQDGVDDGRSADLRRRGLDLSEKTTNLRNLQEKLNEGSAKYAAAVENSKQKEAFEKSKSELKDGK